MANFKDFKDYKNGDISYNPNVPSYSAKYQLSNDDYNIQQLRKDMIYRLKSTRTIVER